MSEQEILKRLASFIDDNIDSFDGDDFDEGSEVACNGCDEGYDGRSDFCGECWERIAASLDRAAKENES